MHNLLALVTLATLLLFVFMMVRVGRARGQYNVPAPAITGAPEFERHFRVHANTLEGLIIFLPSLWLFSLGLDNLLDSLLGDLIGSVLGVIWIIGRVIYMVSYVRDPGSRSAGFGIQGLATLAALLGGVVVSVLCLVKLGL